ncbi:Uncharacterised protein [Nocardia africana]|uniref:Uncharacterized protein n=1 Tax=Nocardia africana TaxID=134964 RepID=A0A378WZH5_9NOCA|nr:Uncharacterised protein [Nocardia africana]
MLGLLIFVCLLSVAVYYAVLYWPPIMRKPRSADKDRDLRAVIGAPGEARSQSSPTRSAEADHSSSMRRRLWAWGDSGPFARWRWK